MSSTMEETPVDESCDQDNSHNEDSCSGDSLYELMPKIPIYDSNGEDSITDSDPVQLDTNRESLIFTKETEYRTQQSNQYMENVKYSGYEGESDFSSDEDPNSECYPTVRCFDENCLCKLCCSSHLGYDSNVHCTKHVHPLFKYTFPYEPSTSVPLLQLYCQRCEKNYNLDIDIVLIYVNSVISQLKKISDGDYLTKEVKERWMAVKCEIPNTYTEIEVISNCESFRSENDFIDLSNDSPLKTETNNECLFDCEVIIKEASQMLTDSEQNDMTVMRIENLDKVHPTESVQQNLQITFKMEPSILEYFFWSIDTLTKLEERKVYVNDEKTTTSMLPMPTKANSFLEFSKYLKSIERYPRPCNSISRIVGVMEVACDTNEAKPLNNDGVISCNNLSENSSKTTVTLADVLARLPKNQVNSKHSPFNPTSVDELKVSIQNLDIQPCLVEESNEEIQETVSTVTKPKSNIFKSPYENQSLTLEERRRKRLLEIRDNRDKKTTKIINEQQVGKFRRNAKSRVTASKSVTKLSITNKSFYNSIFGQHNKIMTTRNFKTKTNRKYLRKDKCLRDTLRQKSKERVLSPANTRINIPSEVKFMLRDLIESNGRFEKSNTQILKPADSRSLSSNSIDTKNIKVNLLSENNSDDKFFNKSEIPDSNILHNTKSMHHLVKNIEGAFRSKPIRNVSFTKISTDDCKILDPIDENDRLSEKKYPSRIEVECRESIGKIYDLMRKLGTTDKVALKNTKTKFTASSAKQQVKKGCELPTWDSKSGGTCKQCSNISFKSSSAEKLDKNRFHKFLQFNCIKEPKVIIKTKNAMNDKKLNVDLAKEKDYKKINLPTTNKPMPPNPLPAITKVLNEMNNLQRAKQKVMQEQRQVKYTDPNSKDYSKKSPRLHNRHNLDNRNEKLVSRTQQNRDKRSKKLYKLPDNVIEKNRTPRRTSETTDEDREARGEAVRGPPTSRLDALAQPRQSYVKAHSEQIVSKYGRSLMTERLQRFVHVQQSHPPVTYQQYVKLKSGFINDNKPSVTKNPAAEKCKLQRSSTFVEPKAISSTSREGLVLKRNPGAIASPRGNTICSNNNNASSVLAPKPKQGEMKTWIPLITKSSEHYELGKEDTLETLIDKIVKLQRNGKQLKVTQEKHHKHDAAKVYGENKEIEPVLPSSTLAEAGVAKVKNGVVIIETEDLMDSDICNFSNSLLKNLHFEHPPLNNKNKVNAVTTLEKVNTGANSDINEVKQNVITSNFPLNNVSLKNILVLQAGDASNTGVASKSTSMRNFFTKNSFKIKSYTNLRDLQGLISLSKELSAWDMQPIPRQISAIYYSFPEMCTPKVMGKSKICYTASMVDFNIVHRSTEYIVSSTTHQSQISYSQENEKPKQAKPDNAEDKFLVTNSVTNTGVEGQLETTSSIDVLFKLLNEIHSISMGTMQVASVYGFQMVENVKPIQYATTYNIMSTTEEVIVGYTRDKDMQEAEYKLKKAGGLQAFYEYGLKNTDLRSNPLKDRRLNPNLHTLLSPNNQATSVTGLNIELSPNNDAMVKDATREPYNTGVKCKKSNKVKQHKVKVINNESSVKLTNNIKLKKDLLIYTYVILILTVFAVFSIPGYSIQHS